MQKSVLKAGGHHGIFSVFEVKNQKYYKHWTKETVFVYILGFNFYGLSRAKTYLHNKYMV